MTNQTEENTYVIIFSFIWVEPGSYEDEEIIAVRIVYTFNIELSMKIVHI